MGFRKKEMCDFEKIILRAIENSGMSQVELATKSEVSQGLISLFMESDTTKRRTITLPVAERLCKALGIQLVQKGNVRKGEIKMSKKCSFRNGFDRERVKKLCQIAIKIRRGKMVAEKILKELDSEGLSKKVKKQLSKWVKPKRNELIQPVFEVISEELFGRRIGRDDDC